MAEASSNSSGPSLKSLLNFASGLLAQFPFSSNNAGTTNNASAASITPFANAPSCPVDSPLSCHNTTAPADSCCFIYPGGQLLSTQFWDYAPAIGPDDSWTLHGLWPDLCDGTYPTYCTSAPKYYNISTILSKAGQSDLLTYMNEYWLPNRGTPETFWEHEWNKHGTCINTLSPTCYGPEYAAGDEVVDFFNRAVTVFKGLDTYKALAAANILPSTTKTYTNEEIQNALKSVTGEEVVLGCSRGKLNQAWYSFNVKGSIQTGEFVATSPAGKGGKGTCPSTGIKYLPKTGGAAAAADDAADSYEASAEAPLKTAQSEL